MPQAYFSKLLVTVGVDIATVSRVVRPVTDYLKYYILRFPITDRQNKLMKDGCHAIASFPSVISAVDRTHIRIIEPQNYVENYVNRNINVHVLLRPQRSHLPKCHDLKSLIMLKMCKRFYMGPYSLICF